MALYLPGPGYVGMLSVTTVAGTGYMTLGPIGSDLWVRDVEVSVTGAAAGSATIGLGVSDAAEASAHAYGSSRPLVHQSVYQVGGRAAFRVQTAAASFAWVRVPVGIMAPTGAKFVAVVVVTVGAGNNAFAIFSVRTLRIVRGEKVGRLKEEGF